MAELKTKKTEAQVSEYIAAIQKDSVRKDCERLIKIMSSITKENPAMWGKGIVAFGDFHYRYPSGREGDWFKMGFAVRGSDITIYCSFDVKRYASLLAQLGKHKTGGGCLYIKSLEDLDLKVLETYLRTASTDMIALVGAARPETKAEKSVATKAMTKTSTKSIVKSTSKTATQQAKKTVTKPGAKATTKTKSKTTAEAKSGTAKKVNKK